VTVRSSSAQWHGDLKSGNGEFTVGSGVYTGAYTFATRFEEAEGTNPEELLGAAHAACFSMSLANMLSADGAVVDTVRTQAKVHLERVDGSPKITRVELTTFASAAGVEDDAFQRTAQAAKDGCPVSKLFSSAEITVDATLE
jgi:lipoyl-dependent peroxiredoxin